MLREPTLIGIVYLQLTHDELLRRMGQDDDFLCTQVSPVAPVCFLKCKSREQTTPY